MKFALKVSVAGFMYLAVLAAYAQEKKEEAAEPVKDVEGVIRRVIEGVKPGAPAAAKPGEKKKEEEAAVEVPRAPVVELGPKFIRLHLQDGSVISGDLSVTEVTVETQFGKLTVPISKIRSFTPGLDSNKKAAEQINALIEKLGGDDYKTREQAHKELSAMGVRVQRELEKHVGSENAELKRHVSEILKELEEAAEEQADDDAGSGGASPWIQLDTIVTTDFAVLGKVTPQDFTIDSKYGPLKIALGDITKAERETSARESYKTNMSVGGDTLAQRGFKSSGLKVQAGDKIVVKAEGSIVMSPWGSNAHSGPDGMPNYGWYIPNQIPGGALCARIGEKGQPFKVGRSLTFVAKNSGTLQFAIGIQGEYAGEGYQFPGEYKLKLRVDPK
jgi:gas vesicle protein